MKSIRSIGLYAVLLGIVSLFMFSSIYSVYRLSYSPNLVAAGTLNEGLWAVVQAELEIVDLLHLLARFHDDAAGISTADISQQLDIVWSRKKILENGVAHRFLIDIGSYVDTLGSMRSVLTAADPLMEQIRAGNGSAVQGMYTHIAPLQDLLHDLSIDVIHWQAATATTAVAKSWEELWHIMALLLITLLSSGAIAKLLIWQVRAVTHEAAIRQTAERLAEKRAAELRASEQRLEHRVAERTAELQASQKRFEDFAMASADWFWEMDADLRFTYMSPNVEQIVNVPPEWHYGKTRKEILGEELDSEIWETHFQTLQARKPFRDFIYPRVGAGIETRWLRASGVPVFTEDGAFCGYRGSGSDVTLLIQAEQTLKQEHALLAQRVQERTAELHKTNEQLAATARAKDEFLAGMSHELRTPLNAILGLSELLQNQIGGPLNTDQQRHLGLIHESGQRLLELINAVLDIAQASVGEMKLAPTKVTVDSICQAALRLVKTAADKKRLRIVTSTKDAPQTIWADQRRLQQILVNLLSNAVKFTPHKGSVGLEVAGDADVVRFVVWDTGIGIAADAMEQLFKPFVQLDNRISRDYNGAGLGLALVYHMVEMHGGSVAVESTVGTGSRFIVTLPRKQGAQKGKMPMSYEVAKGMPALASAYTNHAGEPASKALILVAEDDEQNGIALTEYLRSNNYRTLFAHDGSETIQRAREDSPNLILMDIQMPGMDGLEVIRRLRQEEELAATPIIALTTVAVPGDRKRFLQAGADVYVQKPINMNKLVKMIEAQLKFSHMDGSKHYQVWLE